MTESAEQQNIITSKVLGYLGVLPFILSLTLSYFGPFDGLDANFIFIAYSAAILSFLAGTLWHADTHKRSGRPKELSNAFCLAAFSSLLIYYPYALLLQIANFSLLYFYEKNYLAPKPKEYMALRFRLTSLVVSLHLLALVLWFV